MIGRLLYDSKSIFEDQLDAIRSFSTEYRDIDIDFSLVTDGLKSEREQGITIDVAYRYFSTPKRRFIIADTPGHEQYTRNMATGCSTASLALILIDATKGVVTQTRRHTFISSLLGIKHLVVAVNKMDLVRCSEERYTEISDDFRAFSDKLPVESIQFIPISALHGDNVIERSSRMPWYHGPSLLDYLETVNVSTWRNLIDFRFPVQYVNWSGKGSGIRGYCGTVASGIIRPGENVTVLPSGKRSRVKKVVTFEGEQPYAYAPQAITIYLEDDIDISRGDMIIREKNRPVLTRDIETNIIWMDERPLEINKTYLIKHTTHTLRGIVRGVTYRLDPEDLHRKPAETLHLNEIGRASLQLLRPVYCDTYEQNRNTGCFIVIDPMTNRTVGAGLITRCGSEVKSGSGEGRPATGRTYWAFGRKSDGTRDFGKLSDAAGQPCVYLDDGILDSGVCADLKDTGNTDLWIRRVSSLCKAVNESGISVFIESRHYPCEESRLIIGDSNLVLIDRQQDPEESSGP